MAFSTRDDLDSRLRYLRSQAGRGLAFCVGSGLTAPQVPGVRGAVQWMRACFVEPSDLAAFDSAIDGTDGGAAYQAGARLVLARRGQAALNSVVRSLVLNAHKPTLTALSEQELDQSAFTEAYCAHAEQDLGAWYMPRGVTALAKLLVHDASFAAGPVITTNFDPLLEIAIRREGGLAVSLNLDADGRVGDLDVGDGAIMIIHLHGFWRSGDTLHVAAQLTRSRDVLQASLEDILRERTVLVTGYGGWDDVFTTSLAEAVRRHRHGDLDILWAFFEGSDAEVLQRYPAVLDQFGFIPGRISFYRGVDCVSLFEDLVLSFNANAVQDASGTDFDSPAAGWTAVTPGFLLEQEHELTESGLVRFFDGQVSTWQHALSSVIPALARTESLVAAITSPQMTPELRLHHVSGPAGEGKSTLARQVAARVGRLDRWRVLWREPDAGAAIEPDALAQGDWTWVLVVDDADTCLGDCFELVRRLHEDGRRDVQIIMATRESDWRIADGPALPWASHADVTSWPIRGISEGDALKVVDAWAVAGGAGLGDLAQESDPHRRAASLHQAARSDTHGAEGSFLGAMLRVRLGTGLTEHVKTLMTRLRRRTIRGGGNLDLLRPFLLVSCMHARNVLTLPPEALSIALAVDFDDLQRTVIWPLGDEAAVVQAGAYLVVRHRAIAEAAVALAPQLGEDVGELYYNIIRSVVKARQDGTYVTNMASILYLGSHLLDSPAVAVRAARAPVDQEPDRMSYRTTLSSVMRRAGRLEEAIAEASSTFSNRATMVDAPMGVRRLLFEWGVCAGVANMPAVNAMLSLMILADIPGVKPVELASVGYALSGLEEGLGRLAESEADVGRWKRAIAAVEGLREYMDRKALTIEDVRAHVTAIAELGPALTSRLEAVLPDDLVPPGGRVTLSECERTLGSLIAGQLSKD